MSRIRRVKVIGWHHHRRLEVGLDRKIGFEVVVKGSHSYVQAKRMDKVAGTLRKRGLRPKFRQNSDGAYFVDLGLAPRNKDPMAHVSKLLGLVLVETGD